jgi:hypothetical protein
MEALWGYTCIAFFHFLGSLLLCSGPQIIDYRKAPYPEERVISHLPDGEVPHLADDISIFL